jgi:hypothetical protein
LFDDWCFSGWLDRGAATPTGATVCCGSGLGRCFGRRGGCRSATTTGSRGWRRDSRALFTLPPCTYPRDLVVAQRTQMTPHRKIHLTKEVEYLVTGYSELACQIVNSKLAQSNSS